MPGPFPFEQILAADPSNPAMVARNGEVLLFAPGDPAMTPLVIWDLSHTIQLPNPVTVNDLGFGPAFIHDTLDQVAWSGGGLSGTFESYQGMKDEAVAARAAAEAAAALVGAPADDVVSAVLSDPATAANLALLAQVNSELAVRVSPLVSDAISKDPTVAQSAATMAQSTAGLVPAWKASTSYTAGQRVIAPNGDIVSAKVNFTSSTAYSAANWNASTQDGRIGTLEGRQWQQGTPANGTDVGTLQTTGHYPIPSSATANTLIGLPVLYPGTLLVFMPSASVGYQQYTTFGDVTNNALSGSWIRLRQSSTTWGRWWRLGEAYLYGNLPATAATPINLDTYKVAGLFTVNNTTTISYTTGLPVAFPGVLENLITQGAALSTQRFTVYGDNAALYWRVSSNVSGGWGPWNKVATDTGASPAAVVDDGPYQHLVRDNDMRRRRFNKVTAPGVAVLIFDHGLTNFKSTVWPLLQARNLPVTVAINPGQMTQAQNSGATYADMQTWAATGLVEPANHSYNHIGGTDYDTEIRASRVELETQLGQTIDTWVHPGNVFGDFTVTADPNLYWSTPAGRMILANHAAVTGLLESSTLPLGMNTIGAAGAWIDASGSTAGVQTAITNAETKKGIQIVRWHPQFLNDAGKLTTAELTTFLDWMQAEVTAGRLSVLTFRDAMSAVR